MGLEPNANVRNVRMKAWLRIFCCSPGGINDSPVTEVTRVIQFYFGIVSGILAINSAVAGKEESKTSFGFLVAGAVFQLVSGWIAASTLLSERKKNDITCVGDSMCTHLPSVLIAAGTITLGALAVYGRSSARLKTIMSVVAPLIGSFAASHAIEAMQWETEELIKSAAAAAADADAAAAAMEAPAAINLRAFGGCLI